MPDPIKVFKRNYRSRLHLSNEIRYGSDINPDSTLHLLINYYDGAIVYSDGTIQGNRLLKPDTIYTKIWYSPSPQAPNAGAWTPHKLQIRGNRSNLHREFNKASKKAKVTENIINN